MWQELIVRSVSSVKWIYSIGKSLRMAKCSSSDLSSRKILFFSHSLFPLQRILPWFRCFLAWYSQSKMHLDFTFVGLGSDFLNTCPIKALLEGFPFRCKLHEHYSWSFSHYCGQLSDCNAFNAKRMSAFSFLFLLFLVQSQVTIFLPRVASCSHSPLTFDFPRLGRNPQCPFQL